MEPLYKLRLSKCINCSFQVLKTFTDTNILKKMYLTYIRPKLKYNTPIWSPYLKKDNNHLESIQKKIYKNSLKPLQYFIHLLL